MKEEETCQELKVEQYIELVRKKVMKLAKGYFGSKHRLYKTAKEQVMHSLKYSYRDRRQKKEISENYGLQE